MGNANYLKEGIAKTGRFEIVSKDTGVPLVAASLKDTSKYSVFQISENLRRFGWIIPAYTMAPDAQHIAVLRVVIREDFSRSLAERLISDIGKILKELDSLPSQVSTKAAHITTAVSDTKGGGSSFKTEDVVRHWRRLVGDKTNGVC